MRKNNLLEEYIADNYFPGSYNLEEFRTFFGGQLLTFENEIEINDEFINYFDENEDRQFLDLFEFKKSNISYNINPSQQTEIKNEKPEWVFNIRCRNILMQYLKSMMYKYMVFSNIDRDKIPFNQLDNALDLFIKNMLLPNLTLDTVEFFVQYKTLENSQDYLYLVPKYEVIQPELNLVKESYLDFSRTLEFESDIPENLTLIYNQKRDARDQTFAYQYNLIFKRL